MLGMCSLYTRTWSTHPTLTANRNGCHLDGPCPSIVCLLVFFWPAHAPAHAKPCACATQGCVPCPTSLPSAGVLGVHSDPNHLLRLLLCCRPHIPNHRRITMSAQACAGTPAQAPDTKVCAVWAHNVFFCFYSSMPAWGGEARLHGIQWRRWYLTVVGPTPPCLTGDQPTPGRGVCRSANHPHVHHDTVLTRRACRMLRAACCVLCAPAAGPA